MPVSGQVGIHATITQTGTADLGSLSNAFSFAPSWDITSGVAANQADDVWSDNRTLTTGAFEDLDLSGASLTNAFGVALAFVKIKAILVAATGTLAGVLNTTNLTVGAAASNGFVGPFGAATHTLILKPGDCYGIFSPGLAGWPVTATTADLLRVTNAAGASASYTIVIVGTKS